MVKASLKVIFFILLTCTILFGGCIVGDNKQNELPTNKYIAVEEIHWDHGVVVEGYFEYIREAVPAPIVEYDSAGKYVENNNSLKILYGFYHSHDMPEGMWRDLNISGIYEYPYQLESGAKIIGTNHNGTIILSYNNETIPLDVGKKWESPNVETRFEDRSYPNSTYKVKITTTWTIENKGIYNK